MGPGVVDERMAVGHLCFTDQRESVDHALGAFLGQLHIQVIARQARAQRYAHRAIAPGIRDRHCAICDVKRRAALVLYAHMIHLCICLKHDLGHRVGEAGAIVQRDEFLDQGERACPPGYDQATRVAHGVGLRRDKKYMHRRVDDRIACGHDQGAGVQERGIERRESLLFEGRMPAEVGLDQRAVRGHARRKVEHFESGVIERILWCKAPVYEYQPGCGFGQRVPREVLLRNLRRVGRGNANRLQRQPGQRRQVGEAPVFVARGWHGQRACAFDRAGAQLAEPCGRRRSGLRRRQALEQLVEIISGQRGRHGHALTPASALTQS